MYIHVHVHTCIYTHKHTVYVYVRVNKRSCHTHVLDLDEGLALLGDDVVGEKLLIMLHCLVRVLTANQALDAAGQSVGREGGEREEGGAQRGIALDWVYCVMLRSKGHVC
jgi:hypothetical protein